MANQKKGAKATVETKSQAERALDGAELLAVITDRLQEISTPELAKKAAFLTAEAYSTAGHVLRRDGRLLAAADAFRDAASHYDRTRRHSVRRKTALLAEESCRMRHAWNVSQERRS